MSGLRILGSVRDSALGFMSSYLLSTIIVIERLHTLPSLVLIGEDGAASPSFLLYGDPAVGQRVRRR
jgi:hypothetical protein